MGDIPLCHPSSSATEEIPLLIIKKKVKIVLSFQWSPDHSKDVYGEIQVKRTNKMPCCYVLGSHFNTSAFSAESLPGRELE